MKRSVGITLAAAAALVLSSNAWAAKDKLELTVVSSPPQYVSGDDARVEVSVPDGTALSSVTVKLNGTDVTSAFGPDPEGGNQLEGVVAGLPLGPSSLTATMPGPGKSTRTAKLELTNNPLQGPIFSGPHQTPFLCASPGNAGSFGLPPIAQSPTCFTPTVVSFVYRNTGGAFVAYDPAAPPPSSSISVTTTLDGKTVPMIFRWERGVINRFMYSIMMLSPQTQNVATPDLSAWNGKALFSFSGGVAIGHYQGSASGGDLRHLVGLSMGYAVLYSSGLRTNTHYNLQLGGETAIMLKDRFVSAYAEPEYTLGVGGSGGAIQQYVYGQNHPGLLDGGVPQYSYPDMVTQTIHVGDCELLEHWLDRKVLASPLSMWRTWVNRSLIEGLNASATRPNPYAAVMPYMPTPGSTECINGWRGLSPLALNPHWYGTGAVQGPPGYDPAVYGPVEWTHWGDLVNIYGTDEHGFARSPWDNVGVQYGLEALQNGAITPAQFLDLNANVGSWKPSHEMVQEGCPYIPAACANPANIDVWSSRNMNLSPDGGVTPAARREGNQEAGYAAYRSGMVFRGKIDIPLIDWRHYLEDELDMHNSHQSFAARQRMLNYDGDASNQVIWFTDARPARAFDQTAQAFLVLDQWITTGVKPAAAVDSCFATNGTLIASGADVWNGILDDKPAGACTQWFQIHETSRIVAGGPIEGGVFKCSLQPVERALAHGLYGSWEPTAEERARLHAIFPSGVCDYSKPDQMLPPELHGSSKGAKK
jgi:hypothetical protein